MRGFLKYWPIFIILAILFFSLWKSVTRNVVIIERASDTVIVRDTIRDTILIPRKVYVSRVDTVFLKSTADTVEVPVIVPIERKEYRTDDYAAVIEGFRPQLVSMELFPKTTYITNTETRTITRRQRFGLGIQAGYGYGFNNGKMQPYIGIGIQYNILSF